MIKKIALWSVATIGLVVAMSHGIAADSGDAASHKTDDKAALSSRSSTVSNQDNLVKLYNKPDDKGAVIRQLAPNIRLIPIYQQGDWIKVGNPQDGQVGWINALQYQKARTAYYRPDIQTLYVHIDGANKGKKPTLNVVAYNNGKRLSDKDALALYHKLRAEQQKQYQRMQQFSLSMTQMMQQDFMNAQRMFNSSWMQPTWMQPIILVPVPDRQKSKSKTSQQPLNTPAKLGGQSSPMN